MTSLGVDAVEVSRIERLLRRHPTLKPKLFSRDEIAYCERARRAGPHFAARFCAKEATFKALGGEWLAGEVAWHEVEVVRAPHGRPSLHLSGATLERFRLLGYTASDVTLSHTHDLAFAVVAVAGDAAPGRAVMTPVAIRGLGTYLPGRPITSAQLGEQYGPFVAAISEELGVSVRHWCVDPETGEPHEDNASVAAEASRRALREAGIEAAELDLIIVATVSADYLFPGPAPFVQERLGARAASVIDLRAGCFGLAQGLAIAQQFLASGTAQRVLVVGSEVLSPLLHAALRDADRFSPRQRTNLRVTASLFGDAAGAMVLTPGRPGERNLVTSCQTYSVGWDRPPGIWSAIGGVKMPMLYREDLKHTRVMEHDYDAIGRFFTEVAERLFDSFGPALRERLEALQTIVPAQANGNIRKAIGDVLRRRCGDNGLAARTQDKIFVDIADVGNTGAASIYIALDKLRRSGRWVAGARMLLVPAEATKWFFGTVELVG